MLCWNCNDWVPTLDPTSTGHIALFKVTPFPLTWYCMTQSVEELSIYISGELMTLITRCHAQYIHVNIRLSTCVVPHTVVCVLLYMLCDKYMCQEVSHSHGTAVNTDRFKTTQNSIATDFVGGLVLPIMVIIMSVTLLSMH